MLTWNVGSGQVQFIFCDAVSCGVAYKTIAGLVKNCVFL